MTPGESSAYDMRPWKSWSDTLLKLAHIGAFLAFVTLVSFEQWPRTAAGLTALVIIDVLLIGSFVTGVVGIARREPNR